MADTDEWKQVVQKTCTMVRSAITQLHTIWTEVGYDKETQISYTNAALDHIQELLTDMVSESEEKKRLLLEESKQLMQNTSILCKELKETIDANGYEKLPLFKLQQVLRHDMEKLLRIKEQRKTYLNELLTKEHEICKRLGVQPVGIESKLLTKEELDNFKLYIDKQEAEKDRLESEFKNKYNYIAKMVHDLGFSPSSHFEEIVCNDPDSFVLNSANMAMLNDFQEMLERQLNSAKEAVENKKEELLALLASLNEPSDFCQAFFDNHPGYSKATLKAINAEIGRCKERAHIAKYVNKVRTELVNMWDLCKYGESQRKKFTSFYSRTYTKDLLTLHELEVEKVRKYYETNKEIFNLLEEREKLWTKMKELEYRANNPDRLKNRGGQLLAEEKERKVIQRKLPKIESQLHHLVEEYETRHGEMFYVNGVSLEEFLAQSYGHRNIEKECQKNPRKEIKDKSANKTSVTKLTPTASTSRHLTPLSTSSNRKLFFGSTPKSSGKRRNVGNNKVHSVTYALKIRKSGNISKRALSENKKRRSVKKESRSQSQNATTIDMTYGQFQEHLKDREECRSSLLTNQSLSTKSVFKTPNRTHVKPFRRKLYNVNASSNATSKLLQSTRDSPRSPRIESYFET